MHDRLSQQTRSVPAALVRSLAFLLGLAGGCLLFALLFQAGAGRAILPWIYGGF